MAETGAFDAEHGEDHLKGADAEQGKDAVEQGDIRIGHGEDGGLGEEHGGNELRHLQFSDLPLSHQTDDTQQKKVRNSRAEQDCGHEKHSFQL
jgi:hypothetical protein